MTKSALSIIDAIDDPALFAPWFQSAPGHERSTWWAWRVVLKAAFGLPMADDEIAFFRTVAERDPPPHRVKEIWIIVGRRGGKDSVASVVAAYIAAMFADHDHRLRPGERALVVCLAVDRDQAKIILNYTRSYFNDIDMLQGMVSNETASGFELTNGVDVSVTTNNFRSVRGRAVLVAICDEIAFWRDDTSASPDVETYNALRPGLASLPESMLVAISSPYAKNGLLYKKYKDHYGKNSPDVLVIKAPTRTFNPTIEQSIVDEAMAEDPAVARAEWLAEFRDDISGFVDRAVLEAAVARGRHELPPVAGVNYIAAVDPSGGSSDSMTLAIAHRDKVDRAVLDAVRERRPPFSPQDVVIEFAELLKSYKINRVTGDHWGGEFVREPFRLQGIQYELAEKPKSDFYRELLPLINSRRTEFLDHPRLISQLAGLERRVARGGRDSIDHSPGSHDDIGNVAAIALVLALRDNWAAGLGILEYYRQLSEETKADAAASAVTAPAERKLIAPAGTSAVVGMSGRPYAVGADGVVTVTDYDAKSLLLVGFRETEKPAQICAPVLETAELSNGG